MRACRTAKSGVWENLSKAIHRKQLMERKIYRTESASNGKFIERKVHRTESSSNGKFIERKLKVYRTETENLSNGKLTEQQLIELKNDFYFKSEIEL